MHKKQKKIKKFDKIKRKARKGFVSHPLGGGRGLPALSRLTEIIFGALQYLNN
jgi:hypothetical protein